MPPLYLCVVESTSVTQAYTVYMRDKSAQRRDIARRLAKLTLTEKQQQARDVNSALQRTVDWRTITNLLCYRAQSAWHELPLDTFTDWITQEHPHITLEFVAVTADANIPPSAPDVIILPAVAVDRHGNRLGRGAGWYDRLLANYPSAISITPVYDVQLLDSIPHEAHDRLVDIIVTPSRTITRS